MKYILVIISSFFVPFIHPPGAVYCKRSLLESMVSLAVVTWPKLADTSDSWIRQKHFSDRFDWSTNEMTMKLSSHINTFKKVTFVQMMCIHTMSRSLTVTYHTTIDLCLTHWGKSRTSTSYPDPVQGLTYIDIVLPAVRGFNSPVPFRHRQSK